MPWFLGSPDAKMACVKMAIAIVGPFRNHAMDLLVAIEHIKLWVPPVCGVFSLDQIPALTPSHHAFLSIHSPIRSGFVGSCPPR